MLPPISIYIPPKHLKISHMFKEYIKAFANTLFPKICLYCEKKISKGYLCTVCYKKIFFIKPPLCIYCSSPINHTPNNICKKCTNKLYPYDKIISITAYKEPMITLIHYFKYKNYDFLAKFLSSLMSEHLLNSGFNLNEYDFITSVPAHPTRLKERGYNQAELLGKLLSNSFKIPFKNGIINAKIIKPSQTILHKAEREINVKGSFGVKERMMNKKIILVDDIVTTGSTIKVISEALKKKGADNVTVITLSKTL